jgi:hypothetical protein
MRALVLLASVWLCCELVSVSHAAQAANQAEKASAVQEGHASQNSVTYRVGMKSIAVPPPADLVETGPDYRVLFEHDAPDTNRLVAAFLPSEDVAKLPASSPEGLPHYAFLETLRQAEFVNVDEATYKQIAVAVAKQFGASPDAPVLDLKAFQDEVNHKLKAVGGAADVSLKEPVMLGTFFSKPNAMGVGMLMDVGAGGKTKKVIVGTTFLRAKNRLLYASVFAEYNGDNSVAWVHKVAEQWADAILKANAE